MKTPSKSNITGNASSAVATTKPDVFIGIDFHKR
jgi:hypothetical protein